MENENDTLFRGGELVLFQVDDMLCGIDTLHVQEIIQSTEITIVHRAPDYVRGVINLRGEIVSIIDLRRKFDLDIVDINDVMQIVVVIHENESIGLLVDSMHDVISVDRGRISPPPSNIGRVSGTYLNGVLQMEKQLVAILNLVELLKK